MGTSGQNLLVGRSEEQENGGCLAAARGRWWERTRNWVFIPQILPQGRINILVFAAGLPERALWREVA